MRTVTVVAVALLAFVACIAHLVVLVRLRPHRTDLEPHQHIGEGRSPFWQINAFKRANYTPEGRRLLRWMSLFQVIWIVSLLLIAGLFMGLL